MQVLSICKQGGFQDSCLQDKLCGHDVFAGHARPASPGAKADWRRCVREPFGCLAWNKLGLNERRRGTQYGHEAAEETDRAIKNFMGPEKLVTARNRTAAKANWD